MAQAGEGCAGLLAAQLTLAATAARPGDAVTALLQVSCAQPEALELQEVEVEFSGVERVDTSWVLPTYRRATPPINADTRKVQRYVVQSRLQAATQGTFSDLTLRRFVVRFTLPPWLPPTFRGTAARYLYFLQATVKYRGAEAGGGGGSVPGSVACRAPLHIWPARQQQLEGATLERTPSLAAAAGGGAAPAPDGSLLSPPLQTEDMPIKCWEIGPGTAVQDAVAHIIKLASQPTAQSPGRPQSPGRMVRGGATAGSGDGDAHSEISHEPEAEEADKPPARGGGGATAGAAAAGAAAQPPAEAAQGGAAGSELGSGASTPRSSRLLARRSSLTRPSLEMAASLTLPRSPSQLLHDGGATLRSYALRIGDQPLVRVSLHPPLEGGLHPGSTLAGTLEFTHPALSAAAAAAQPADGGGGQAAAPRPRCMQVLILLETEEVVEAPWRRPVAGGGAGGIRRVHDEHLEMTADTACTHFLFTLPPDAAASFQTPLLQLRWLLRFQFTASLPPAGAAPGAEWNALAGRLEQLAWTLPLTVLPPAA